MTLPQLLSPAKKPAILFSRQKQLLRLLDAVGGSAGKLDFQKLLFLYCEEPASGRPYDFIPYKFGAFSFTSYADRRKLVERGFLVDDEHRWALTDEGRRVIGRTPDMQLTDFARRYRTLRGDPLIAEAYRRFPFFAIRSEIAARVLDGDREALARIDAARPAASAKAIQTIGYEGHTLESYLNVLVRAGVTTLCDVRRNPLSRKYGFSKSTLARGCEAVGLRYEHLPELGISSEQRQGLDTQADYDALFEEYETAWLPKQSDALAKLVEWTRRGEHLALTCYEHDPRQCHRHCVAEALEARYGKGLAAKHL